MSNLFDIFTEKLKISLFIFAHEMFPKMIIEKAFKEKAYKNEQTDFRGEIKLRTKHINNILNQYPKL